MFKFVQEQMNNKEKADLHTDDWHLQDSTRIQDIHHLSVSYDVILQVRTIDKSILEAIWAKVAQLVHSDGFIT